MKKAIVKLGLVGLLMGTAVTQTGCIVGLVQGNIPLAIGGGVVAGAGAIDFISHLCIDIMGSGGCSSTGREWLDLIAVVGGVVLDEKNPGRQDALNTLPVDETVAQELKTNIEGIETYNDELLNVLETNRVIEGHIRSFAENKMTEKDLNQAAQDLGLQNKEKLVDTLKGSTLKSEDVESFAQAQKLSSETAKIYLRTRFGIRL